MVPDPLLAPVIPPVMVPTVHENELGVEADKAISGLVPLHIVAVASDVIVGLGFTVTVIVWEVPSQFPVIEVGVTIY